MLFLVVADVHFTLAIKIIHYINAEYHTCLNIKKTPEQTSFCSKTLCTTPKFLLK